MPAGFLVGFPLKQKYMTSMAGETEKQRARQHTCAPKCLDRLMPLHVLERRRDLQQG